MNPSLLVLALLGGMGVFVFFWGMYMTSRRSAMSSDMVQERLQAFSGQKPLTLDEVELQKPFEERFIRPAVERIGKYLAERTPEKARVEMQNKLNLAGRPGNMSPSDFQALRYGAALVLFILGLLLGLLLKNPIALALSPAIGAILGFFGPPFWLNGKVQGRRKEIQLALPDVMDLLTIAVEAGLGFDQAVGLAKILRLQSEEMRRKRRQRAEELAAQASLKMMLPMVGCIFPTLWLILLGPAVLIIMKARGG
jgi:tight adherence protein C